MEIVVNDKKLGRALADDAARKRHFGAQMAAMLRRRIGTLEAAESLADFWPPKSGPERCHELLGKKAGTFSMDLNQPYRLLFKPGSETPKREEDTDEQTWWNTITAIEILGIEDTHG